MTNRGRVHIHLATQSVQRITNPILMQLSDELSAALEQLRDSEAPSPTA
jgi:hypothetical protein